MPQKVKFETLAIQSTAQAYNSSKPVSMPIYLSSTYERSEDGNYTNDFQYSRTRNPNRSVLEKSIAQLEQGESAFAFSSGMAAIAAVFQCLKSGDHVLLPDDIYFNIYQLMREVLDRWGLTFDTVDMADIKAIKSAIKPNTVLIWCETPSNPQLKITDVNTVAQIAHAHQLLLAVDNTWPTPVLQQNIALGAHIVIHSTTKYFGGHSDVLGGAVVLSKENPLRQKMSDVQRLGGAVPSPFDCWLICRGIQTLYLRVMAQSKSAMALAVYLAKHPKIEKVNYPGLSTHTHHEVATKQMPNGFGGMLSILVKGGARQAISAANKLEHFTVATSLGAVESLVEHRKSVEGPDSKTPDNLLRISVGLENIDDLIADWEQALS